MAEVASSCYRIVADCYDIVRDIQTAHGLSLCVSVLGAMSVETPRAPLVGDRLLPRKGIESHARGEALLILVLLAAFALRLFRLAHQPLWSDEIYSVAVARGSLSQVWGWVYRDNHPALYWLLLYPVVHLLGDVPLLVRFPSALMGTLTVAFTYAAGRQIFRSRAVGLLTALWLTLSPLHVAYSQEARMYAPLALFGIASTLFLYWAVVGDRMLHWVLFGATAAATAHTHNYGLLLVAGQAVWGLAVLLRNGELRLIRGSALSAATFLALYAPMIPALTAQMQMPVGSTGIARGRDVFDFFQAFGAGFAGFSTPGLTPGPLIRTTALPSTVFTATLALIGLAVGGRRPVSAPLPLGAARRWGSLLPGIAVLFPLLFVYVYSTLAQEAVWQVRGFQMVLGCFALLVGAGLWSLPHRPVRWLIWLALVGVALLNLHPHYFDRYKSTVPDAVAVLEEQLGPEDILFVAPYWQWTPIRYYYRGPADAIGGWEREGAFQLAGVGVDYAELIDSRSLDIHSEVEHPILRVDEFTPETYSRVWTIGHQATPQRVHEVFGDGVTVMHYDVKTRQWRPVVRPLTISEPDLPDPVEPSSFHWDSGLRLLGYRWVEAPTVGQPARLTLFWTSDRSQLPRSDLRLRLTDANGAAALVHSAPMLSLIHGIPMTSLGIRSDFPATAWPVDSLIAQDVEFNVPPHLPALSYRVELEVAAWPSGEAVSIDGAASASLGTVSVARPQERQSPRVVNIEHRRHILFGDQIGLLGYNLPEAPPRPGHHLPVWLHWSAKGSPSVAYEVQLRLLGRDGSTLAETVGCPSGPPFPTSRWEVGDLAQGRLDIPLPPDIQEGRYRLAARLVDPATGEYIPARRRWSLRPQEWIVLGRAEILSWPLATEPPDIQQKVDARFGDSVDLLGYDLAEPASPEEELSLTLHWRADPPLTRSYHVFIHLIDEAGNLVAQADGIPARWLRPTTTWRQGEVITDEHWIDLPPELPEGLYHLYVGLYEPGAQRLSVVSGGQVMADGRFLLDALQLEVENEG